MKLNSLKFLSLTQKIRYFDTTYKDSWESNIGNIVIKDYKTFSNSKIPSGNETGFKKNDRIMISTQLISEKYNGKKFLSIIY